jgi:hypothetical protein
MSRKCSICKKYGHNSNNKKFHNKNENSISDKNIIDKKIIDKHIINKNITIDEANKSADEWFGKTQSIMRNWFVKALIDEKQHRDIGKVLAYAVEEHVNEFISKKSNRVIKTVIGHSYDGITDDNKPPIKNQIKFRMGAWHFETTRRHSKKI